MGFFTNLVETVVDKASEAGTFVKDKASDPDTFSNMVDSVTEAGAFVKEKAGEAGTFVKDNPGKAAIGAAVGVVAVAAAPFTGGGSLAGAATLAGSLAGASVSAAAAGTVGAVASAKFADAHRKNTEKKGYNKGTEDEKARSAVAHEALKHEIQSLMSTAHSKSQYIVTMFAVGMCAANADGHICDEELDDMRLAIAGLDSNNTLSESERQILSDMELNPLSIDGVIAIIQEHKFDSEEHLSVFSSIVELVIESDGQIENSETKFLAHWNEKTSAAAA